jgi:beta-glucosidase/6-phospho-beta-glucosidase/beta-galactosidase
VRWSVFPGSRGVAAALVPGLLAGASAGAGCRSDAFPDGFLFGASIAGFQVDMGCPTIPKSECEDPNSDWYTFVTSTVTLARDTNHLSGDPPSAGPGYYELYDQDIQRVKDLGLGALRFSLEWSRIFPASTIGVDGHDALMAIASPKALDYYHRQLAALKARGIRPLVTLNHYTLPTWIMDAVGCNVDFDHCTRRGWVDETVITEIAKYAGFVAKEFGGEIDLWATLNEPLAVVLAGLVLPSAERTNPPAQLLRLKEAKLAIAHLIIAHARMVDAVRANDTVDADGDGKPVQIGVVFPVVPVLPKDPTALLDKIAAKNISYIYNDVFLNGVLLGELDRDLTGKGTVEDDLVGRSDYLGMNYYVSLVVEGEESSALPDFSPLLTFNPLTFQETGPRPVGLYEALLKVKDQYPGVPMIVTENGAGPQTGEGPDTQTPFLVQHLEWLRRAQDKGADVRGYFWWTLMDNYEWNHGMQMKFGLYAVDPKDPMKVRTARPITDAYRRIATGRKVPSDLALQYPIDPAP